MSLSENDMARLPRSLYEAQVEIQRLWVVERDLRRENEQLRAFVIGVRNALRDHQAKMENADGNA